MDRARGPRSPLFDDKVVVESLNTKINLTFGETQNKKHAAAIEAAIDMAQLPSARLSLRSRATASVKTFLSKRRLARTSCSSRASR